MIFRIAHYFIMFTIKPFPLKIPTEGFQCIVRYFNCSRLPITRTLANSNQNRFPLDFRHTFTVILPSITRILDKSNLPLTRTNFPFPWGHFLYNFTLDNSNHACQDVTAGKKQTVVLIYALKLWAWRVTHYITCCRRLRTPDTSLEESQL